MAAVFAAVRPVDAQTSFPAGVTLGVTASSCIGGPKTSQSTVYTACPEISYVTDADPTSTGGHMCFATASNAAHNPVNVTGTILNLNLENTTADAGPNAISVSPSGCCYNSCDSCDLSGFYSTNEPRGVAAFNGFNQACATTGDKTLNFDVASHAAFDLRNKSFTIEFWVRGSDVSWEPTIMRQCGGGGQNECLSIHQGNGGDDGKLHIVWGGATNTELSTDGSWAAGTNAGLDDSAWHYVAFVYDATQKIRQIYIDGEPHGQDNAPTGQHYLGVPAVTTFNHDAAGGCGGTMANRNIDAVRVENFAMSYAQIRGNYHGGHHFFRTGGVNQNVTHFTSFSCSDGQAAVTVNTQPTGLNMFSSAGDNGLRVRTIATNERLRAEDFNWTYVTDTLPAPYAPRVDNSATTTSSLRWSWDPEDTTVFNPTQARYICDTNSGRISYDRIRDSVSVGGTSSESYNPGGFTPNTRHCLKLTATYTDTGCANIPIGPSAETAETCAYTMALVPAAPVVAGAISGTGVNVTLGLNGNANPTPINVESNGTGTYQQVSSFQNVLPTNRAVTGLGKSMRHFFQSRATNGDGFQTAASGPSASSYVTMPETPATFSGGASQASACPKTTIRWNWSAVISGSGGATQYQVRNTGNTATLCSATAPTLTCDQTGLAASVGGTSQSAVIRAQDTGATFQFSDLSAIQTASTASSEIPQIENLAGTAITPGIQWDWTAPPFLCSNAGGWSYVVDFRHVPDSVLPSVTLTGSPAAQYIQVPLSPNTKSVIAVKAFDSVDNVSGSPLSAEATQYSNANAPTGLTAVQISSTQIVVIWGANSNPNYTRYQTEISADGGANYNLHQTLANNFTVLRDTFTGLTPGASYMIRVRAYNGRGGETFSAPTAYDTITQATMNTPPIVVGTPNSQTQVTWSWNHILNADHYQLYDARTNTQIGADIFGPFPPVGSAITRTQTIAAGNPNTQLSAYVWVYNASGLATTSATSYVYTDPAVPGAASWTGQSSTTVSLAWGANSNPNPGTIYEVNISTDPLFRVVVSTRSFMGLTATVRDLFPATTYYGRVRAYSGSGVISAFTTIGGGTPQRRITDASPAVTLSASPSSVYVAEGQVRGLWQFDDEVRWTFPGFSLSHSSTSDSSDHRNHARPTCTSSLCTSTPTFTGGMPTLSTAIAFGGQVGSHVFVPHIASYDGPGSMTIAVWAKPATVSQQDGTTLAVRQSRAAGMDWSLDLKNTGTGAVYRFNVGASEVVAPASAITAGAWQRVVGIYNSATGNIFIAVDGTIYGPTAGVAARTAKANGHITFGNRERLNTAWNFDRGFIGSLDSIKLLSQAWTASDVANDYTGSFSANVIAMAGVQLSLAPNAFGGLATIYASNDPLNHPIAADPVTVANGLLQAPTGQVLVPNTMVEIVPAVGGLPYSGPMGSTATITMTYADNNNDDILDGINPPIAANTLRMYTLDTTVTRWIALPTTVDRQAKTVTGVTPHFSIFAVFGANTIGTGTSQIKIYPNPWRRGTGGRYDATALTFDNLPTSGRIRIFTLAGERVADLSFAGPAAGSMTWDGRNEAGRNVASGVYFAHVKADDGAVSIIKFGIER